MGLINFSGIASGIDTEGLIKATADATRAGRVTPLQDKVTELTSTDDSLTELKSRLDKLKLAVREFSTASGGGIVKSASSSDESVIGATATNSAFNGTYQITVDARATNAVATFSDAFTDYDQVVNANLTSANYPGADDRKLTFEVGTGADKKSFTLDLDETTTYSSIINKFNSDPTMTSVAVMSAVNVSNDIANPKYRLVISSLNEGTSKGTIAVTNRGAGIVAENVLDPGTWSEQPAVDAQFDIAGIGNDIKRPSNTVTGVIPGVTLNLQKQSVTPATITVQNDGASSKAKIEDFVTAWNDVVTYLSDQNLIQRQDDGTTVSNSFAPLSKTRVDEGSLSALRSVLSSSKLSQGLNADGLEESLVMSSIGLKTNQNGTLSFNPATVGGVPSFDQLVAEQPEAVNSLLKQFADTISSTSGTIDQYTAFGRLIDQTINSNKSLISDYNKRISEAEKAIANTSTALRARYARFEAQIGTLQQQQSQLSSLLR